MNGYSVTGYPQGADADSIGALIAASNGVMHRSGLMGKRTGYASMAWSVRPEAPIFTMFTLNGETYSVSVENYSGSPGLMLRKSSGGAATLLSRDVLCRSTQAYRKLFDDMLDTFKTNEGQAQQIGCFPPITTDGLRTVESGAPRCREVSLISEVDTSTLIGGMTALTSLGIRVGERCAYRAVFSYLRTNGSEVSGAPSGRFVYSRDSSGPEYVCPRLQITLPNGVDLKYGAAYPTTCYISLYRSGVLSGKAAAALGAGDTDPSPGDDMNLVFKKVLSSTDFSFGTIVITDVSPQGMSGEPLYTNGDNTGAERWLPPKSNSVAIYKDTAFYAGAVDRFARITFSLVAVPFVYPGPIVATATTLKIPSVDPAVPTLAVGDTVSVYVTATATATDYIVSGAVTVVAGFIVIPVVAPPAAASYPGVATFGTLNVTVTDPVGGPATYPVHASFAVPAGGVSNKFQVPLAITLDSIARPQNQRALLQAAAANICQGINTTLWNYGHNVVASNLGTKYGTQEEGRITVEADQATALSITTTDTVTDYRSMAARLAGTLKSTPDAGLNSLWWSTPTIYDHVCPGNRRLFGAPDKEILKVVATRDAMYLFKEDGTWVIHGSGNGVWGDTVLSLDLRLLAPSLVTVYKDQVYAATNMGIVELTGGTITVLSDTIRDVYRRALMGRVSPLLGYYFSVGTYADLFCSSCAASWVDNTLTFSIPILTTPVAGTRPMATAYQVFTYCCDTRQWLVSEQQPTMIPAAELAARGGGLLPEQHVVPLVCRPAIALESALYLDASQRQVVRLPLQEFIYTSVPAIEVGSIGGTLTVPRMFSDETGLVAPQGSDVILGTAAMIALQPYHLSLTVADLSLGILPVAGVIDPAGPDQWYWMSNAGVAARVSQFVARDVIEFFTDTGGPPLLGAGTLLCPIQTRWRFAPIGTGSSALNFNQLALLLGRDAAASRIQFTFWLDDGKAYPYVAPTKVTLAGSAVSRNLVRAEVPPSMTRGTRLTIEIYHGVANERLELSKLLLDIARIAGEDVNY